MQRPTLKAIVLTCFFLCIAYAGWGAIELYGLGHSGGNEYAELKQVKFTALPGALSNLDVQTLYKTRY